jgi:hypothetical protein
LDTSLLIQDLNQAYGLELSGKLTEEALQVILAEKINTMINHDFGTLVQLLYRIDVNETKLRRLLEGDVRQDAGMIIAALIIERQWQKIESRRKSDQRPNRRGADGPTRDSPTDPAGEEERW